MIFLIVTGLVLFLLIIMGLIFWALKKTSVYMDDSFRWGGRSNK